MKRYLTKVPGVAAVLCAFVGVWVVTGNVGWGLIALVPFLVMVDRGMP